MMELHLKDGTIISRVQGGLYNGTLGFFIGSLSLESVKTVFSDPAKTEVMTYYGAAGKMETYTGFTQLVYAKGRPDGRIKIVMSEVESNGAD